MEFRRRAATVLLVVALNVSSVANASLVDRGGGLIYDTVLNITWLADANYAKTSGYDADGLMNWSQASTWASNLSYYDSVRNVTYTDWRLPTTNPVNGTTFNYDVSHDGSTDYGYNVSSPGTAYAGSTGSEMAHLFYNTLSNKGFYWPPDFSGPQPGWGLTNTGPFSNLEPYSYYWSGTEYAPDTDRAWSFNFSYGVQDMTYKYNDVSAWAVRSGDVAAASVVPIPAAFWLFGSGLFGMFGLMRRRERI